MTAGAEMTDPYAKWRRRLECVNAGIKPKEWPKDLMATTEGATVEDCGWYRQPVKEKQPNGQWKLLGYHRVELFQFADDLSLGCEIDGQAVASDNIDILSFVAHPVDREWHRVVSDDGRWPDDPAPPEGNIGDNHPPEMLTAADHAAAIDNAIGAAPKAVTSEAEASQALGMKNRLAELRLACDKAGKAEYEPLYASYVKSRDPWQAPVKKAHDAEKRINTMILKFRESERQRIAKEDAAKVKSQAPLEPIAVPTEIKPTYGSRKLKEEMQFFLDTVTSWDMLFAHYKNNAEVQALLMKLASAEIKAGITVPGTTTRQGLI